MMLEMNSLLSKVDPKTIGKKASLMLDQNTLPPLMKRKLPLQTQTILLLHLGMLLLLLPETNLTQRSAILRTECLLPLLTRRQLLWLCMMSLQHKLMHYMLSMKLRKHLKKL